MAARLRRYHQQEVREKIRASQLINVLQDHAFGKRNLQATQVTAALGLLKKCLPDLNSQTISGEEGKPAVNISHRLVPLTSG